MVNILRVDCIAAGVLCGYHYENGHCLVTLASVLTASDQLQLVT
jgi:hypothetical protein